MISKTTYKSVLYESVWFGLFLCGWICVTVYALLRMDELASSFTAFLVADMAALAVICTIAIRGIMRAVKEMADWYDSILDMLPHSVAVADANEKWVYSNKAAARVLGVDRAKGLQDAGEFKLPKLVGAKPETISAGGRTYQVLAQRHMDDGYMLTLTDVSTVKAEDTQYDGVIAQIDELSAQILSASGDFMAAAEVLAQCSVKQEQMLDTISEMLSDPDLDDEQLMYIRSLMGVASGTGDYSDI